MNFGLLALRVIPAAMMLVAHGWPKLAGYADKMNTFFDPIGLGSPVALAMAVFAEVFCSILLILGIGTRLAAIPLFITMAVAGFIVHASDPFAKKEMALLYGVTFLTLMFTGGGAYGLGNRMGSKWLRT